MTLTTQKRDALPESDFAVPGKRALPIHDATHVRMAWNMVDKTKGLSDSERATARRRILRKAHQLGIDTKDWHLQAMAFSAMALAFPDGANNDHVNKLPFEGILTHLDVPSDNPLFGTGGKCVVVPSDVAEAAIGSLLGMAIDFTPEFDGHSPRNKIGIITSAEVEDSAIQIKGYFYSKDFPEEVQRIQDEKDDMGFSFEAMSLLQSMKADPLVVSAIEFTGAAVLYKSKAAYMTTSISARADQEKDAMTPEQEAQLKALGESVKAIPTIVAEAVTVALKASADKAAADKKAADDKAAADAKAEADKKALQAGSAEAIVKAATDAAVAAVAAAMKPVTDAVSSMGTQFKDLQTKIAAGSSAEPTRKTLSPSITLALSRVGLSASADGKPKELSVAEIDAAAQKAGLSRQDSMAMKLALKDANLLKAA